MQVVGEPLGGSVNADRLLHFRVVLIAMRDLFLGVRVLGRVELIETLPVDLLNLCFDIVRGDRHEAEALFVSTTRSSHRGIEQLREKVFGAGAWRAWCK